MEVILLRHGQTRGNQSGVYQGRTDEPLSGKGVLAAQRAGVCPAVSRVFVSPLQRARQTARICFPNAAQVVLDELREMDFGDFEGRSANEMADDPAYRAWVDGYCRAACPNGESAAVFRTRVCAAFCDAVRQAIEAGDDRLYVIAHGGTIMAVMYAFAREPGDFYDWHVPNCGGWRAALDGAQWESARTLRDYARFTRLPM